MEALEGRVVLSTITVLNTNDSGAGSLRAAITQADVDGSDTINFDPSVTGAITLLSALPDLSSNINIDGPGASSLTVARSGTAPDFRIFTVDASVTATISGLTIEGGQVAELDENVGAGIENEGTMTITGVTVFGNADYGDGGGGIENDGTMTVVDSTISNNTIWEDGEGGGGIRNYGTMTITDSTVSGNSGGVGGGIENDGTMTISGTTIDANSTSSSRGGGIWNNYLLTITTSTVDGNSAGEGGGIENTGNLTISASAFLGNSATFTGYGAGGGLDNEGGTATISNSTFNGNSAVGAGGAIESTGEYEGNRYSQGGSTLAISDCTITDNTAPSGGGIDVGGTVTTTGTIFDNPVGGNLNLQANTVVNFTSLGHNLFSDTPSATLAASDLTNTNPLLAPLANYGGPTLTQALLPGSPAINAGANVTGVTSDQRGIARPQGSAPDIGAFESQGFRITTIAGNGQTTAPLAAFSGPLTVQVSSPYGEPVAGGAVTFTAISAGASAVLSGSTLSLDANGEASVTATANSIPGPFIVSAQTAGAPPVSFTLINESNPTVEMLQRFGIHNQPTTVVLSFSTSLDPTSAQSLANYQLTTSGRHPRTIRLRSAVYSAASDTVTLSPKQRLPLSQTFILTVSGHLIGKAGLPLNGSGTSGSNFVTHFGRGALVKRMVKGSFLFPSATWVK